MKDRRPGHGGRFRKTLHTTEAVAALGAALISPVVSPVNAKSEGRTLPFGVRNITFHDGSSLWGETAYALGPAATIPTINAVTAANIGLANTNTPDNIPSGTSVSAFTQSVDRELAILADINTVPQAAPAVVKEVIRGLRQANNQPKDVTDSDPVVLKADKLLAQNALVMAKQAVEEGNPVKRFFEKRLHQEKEASQQTEADAFVTEIGRTFLELYAAHDSIWAIGAPNGFDKQEGEYDDTAVLSMLRAFTQNESKYGVIGISLPREDAQALRSITDPYPSAKADAVINGLADKITALTLYPGPDGGGSPYITFTATAEDGSKKWIAERIDGHKTTLLAINSAFLQDVQAIASHLLNTKAVPSAYIATQKPKEFTTFLQQFCVDPESIQSIGIYTWFSDEEVGAKSYVAANGKECATLGVPVDVYVSSNPNISAGDIVNGKRAIRYAYP